MLRAFLVGVATVTLFLAGSTLGLLTEGDPPSPHVRLPDRGSTLTASPVRHLEEAAAWVVGIQRANIAAYLRSLEQVEQQNAEAAQQPPARAQRAVSAPSEWDGTGTPCAIPQYICDRESGGDPTIYNQSGSGASGKYQAMPGTWGGYAGYANAADAPEEVQDQWAAELWNGGSGCSHWSACG